MIRLLIADDHAVFRSGLRALLEQEQDLEVVAEASDGEQTLAALAAHEVDVLVLDLSMPATPGTRVAKAVMERWPGLAIVVLTMHEDEQYVQELLRAGARAFVLKKSTGEELLKAIRAVAGGGRYLDSALMDRAISSYAGDCGPPPATTGADMLTPREREVCCLLAYGHTNREIGKKLFISERTVQVHRRNIMAKLELRGRAQLVAFALENGLFTAGESGE